jgi:hypothetical protein
MAAVKRSEELASKAPATPILMRRKIRATSTGKMQHRHNLFTYKTLHFMNRDRRAANRERCFQWRAYELPSGHASAVDCKRRELLPPLKWRCRHADDPIPD